MKKVSLIQELQVYFSGNSVNKNKNKIAQIMSLHYLIVSRPTEAKLGQG